MTAALNQIEVATTVTTPILIAVLAIIAGVIIILGAGGGLIKPMQARWESYLVKAEEEAPKMKEQAEQAKNKMQNSMNSAITGSTRRTNIGR
ncbi:hypothetical protein [Cryobacterium sp. M23]|uniref:hypothetical protein n=1 Tax=Cryobacterium sp. M23 TaxID=2048292 RepID=UPI0018ECECA6|nr:hypothetical protein [Cryobacterium sp. M23]